MNKRLGKFIGLNIVFISFLCLLCGISSFNECKAASGITRMQFISKLISGITENEVPNSGIKIKGSGNNITVNGVRISKSLVKKYRKMYGISLKNARKLVTAQSLGIVGTEDLSRLKKKITVSEAADMVVKTHELLYDETADENGLELVLNNRIDDIGVIKSIEKRVNLAKFFMYGYIKGTTKGEYTHQRLLNPNRKLTKKEADTIVKRITDKSKRIELSPDYQVLRKPGKMKNASYYPYILDSFPDAYYETGFNGLTSPDFFEEGKGLGADDLKTRMSRKNFSFVFPSEIRLFNALKYPGPDFSYNSDIFLDCYRNDSIPEELSKSSVEFLQLALNIDYRTISRDKKWKQAISKYLSEDEIEDYIKHCRENKTIIECDLVASDPSSVYWYNGDYNCKCYVHMRVISDYPLENGFTKGSDQDIYGYLYPVRRGYEVGTLFTRSVLGELYMGYKIGEWTDYFINTSGSADEYGCLNCSNTSRSIMIDYSGLCPWLYKMPF